MPRSKVKILIDILETVNDEDNCTKTKIIRLANLDWDMASEYLNDLLNEDFLETVETESKGNQEFIITEDGLLLLKILKKVRGSCSIL